MRSALLGLFSCWREIPALYPALWKVDRNSLTIGYARPLMGWTYRVRFLAPAGDEILGALAALEPEQPPGLSGPLVLPIEGEIHAELREYVMEVSADSKNEAADKVRNALAAKAAEPTDLTVEAITDQR